jgi:sphingomyelin phosphodiesterase 2
MKRSFETIKKRVEQTYPYSHFFRSHIIGSGMCIFCHPIVHTLFHPFAVNGYYDRVFFHGDVLCGKGIGLAVLRVGEFTVNVYVTHVSAFCIIGFFKFAMRLRHLACTTCRPYFPQLSNL